MQRDRFPDQIDLRFGDAIPSEEFAGGISTINLEALGVSMKIIDKAHVVKERGDIEQLGVEFQIQADTSHGTEQIDANGVVEQHLTLVMSHEFGGFARDLAVRNLDTRCYVGHC